MLRKEIYELPQFVLVLSKFIFSLLTILDVRTRRVPPSDVSFLIDERVVPDKKPPIFTVFPASPLLVFERNRARETFLQLFTKSFIGDDGCVPPDDRDILREEFARY
jgi:hypothetical protein